MELIPIAIIVLGIISSIISSQSNKKNEEKRDIDPSKLDRKSKTAPRRRQDQSTEKKGFFENLQETFEAEMKKYEDEVEGRQSEPKKTAPTKASTEQPKREFHQRESQPRETIQRTRDRQNTSQNVSDIEKRLTDRSKHSKRAREAKDSVLTEAYDKRVTMDEGLTREMIQERQQQRENRDKIKDNDITSGDINFDPKSVVNGIIMSEILGKPKSKQ